VSVKPTRTIPGEVSAPPSKSRTHRALFAGLLSKGATIIHNPLICDDTKATVNAVMALGADLHYDGDKWTVKSTGRPIGPKGEIECGESGVTLRFTIPISSLTGSDVVLKGNEPLMRRPLQPLIDAMQQVGAKVDLEGLVVKVHAAGAHGGTVQLPGNVSSQFISGLLLAGPLMSDGLEVRVTSPLESRGYVSLTIEVMKRHGVVVETNYDMSFLRVSPHQQYRPAEYTIPGDYSSAAFMMSAAAVTESKIHVLGLPNDEADPDSAILRILRQMGAEISFPSGKLSVEGHPLRGAEVNIRDCPDLGPVIAVLGTRANGETVITGAERLRYKESDRLAAIASELGILGANVKETHRGLLVSGPCILTGGSVDSHGDHRIAMALAVAALFASGTVTIRNAQCVSKSYPRFFDDLRLLGVEAIER